MLVLTRKRGESIVVNNDIEIVVLEIRGDKIRLGIEAPRDVPVHRREIYDAIMASQPPETATGTPAARTEAPRDAARSADA